MVQIKNQFTSKILTAFDVIFAQIGLDVIVTAQQHKVDFFKMQRWTQKPTFKFYAPMTTGLRLGKKGNYNSARGVASFASSRGQN